MSLATLSERVRGVFTSLAGEQQAKQTAALTTFSELVDRLVAIDRGDDEPLPTAKLVATVLENAGRSSEDLAAAIAARKERDRTLSSALLLPERRRQREAAAAAVDAEIRELRRAQEVHELKLQLRDAERKASEAFDSAATARNRLGDLLPLTAEEQQLAARLHELTKTASAGGPRDWMIPLQAKAASINRRLIELREQRIDEAIEDFAND